MASHPRCGPRRLSAICSGCPLTEKPLEEATMFIRNAWYVAAWADEIGETPLARRICNEPVVLLSLRRTRGFDRYA